MAGRDRSPVRDFVTAAVDVQSRARRFIASTSSSARVATDLLTAVESPEPAETMEGGGGAAAHEPAASTEAAATGSRTYAFNEQAVRQYCDEYNELMKGQTGRDLLFDFKDMHKNLPHFGTVSNADGSILGLSDAGELELGRGIAALVQGTLLGAHLEVK